MSYQQDKLIGFDFQIDAYLNFNMNFQGIYGLINTLAQTVNQQTQKLTDWADVQSRQASSFLDATAYSGSTLYPNHINLNPLGYHDNDDMSNP